MAGLVKRKPRKAIKISTAAKMLGCSAKTIKRGLGDFQTFRLNNTRTSPIFVYEAEVVAFIEKRQKQGAN